MTRIFTFLALSSTLFIFYSCKQNPDCCEVVSGGNWVRRADFDGIARSEAVSFVIGDSAYAGTGYDGTNRLNDFFKLDADNNYWVQRASLPGDGRNSAVGFSTSTKGYITTGYNGTAKLKDTWEYDPLTNTWKQKADFGGSARIDAVAFGINDKGYVTTGNDGTDVKDLWMYDPAADTWAQKANLDGSARESAVVLVYNSQAYIVTGIYNGNAVNDLWVYDPPTDKWTAKRPITNVSTDTYDDAYGTTLIVRSNAAAFVIGDHGYVCTGEQTGTVLKTVWEYDFANDLWTQRTPWEGIERVGAVGFAVKGRGFLGLGRNSVYELDDFREFLPFEAYNVND
jgi:N-acetylneuraminic acid mutarotase